LQDTSVFQTDIREVFDFIRCSENKNELKELVENNRYFRHMEEDAFDVATGYASASELKMAKEKYLEQGGINMCTAIQEMMADSRAEGFNLGISQGISQGINQGKRQIIRNMLARGMSDEDIMALAECAQEEVDKVRQGRENILSNQIL
jgi:predicted transposase/invertase (TIGR01784 family)